MVQVCSLLQISTFTGVRALVLEARLDKFFNCPAVWEFLEVGLACSSLEDPGKSEKIKWVITYHPDDLRNDCLRLAVPYNGAIKPGLGSYIPDTTLSILRRDYGEQEMNLHEG
jgi:hypothetical protein